MSPNLALSHNVCIARYSVVEEYMRCRTHLTI